MTNAASLYGQSLYDLAAEEHLEDEITRQMAGVLQIFRENPEYITLLSEPSIPRKERLDLIDKAFGGELQPYLVNFLKVLVDKGMLREFAGCERRVRSLYNRDHGFTEATVTSAVALTQEQRTALLGQLTRRSGGQVVLTERVDPAVMGGLRVEMGGELLDGTVRGHLDEIRRRVDETTL